jgi:uncharacterized membrane-anchored protein
MKITNKRLLLALVFPMLALMLLTGYKAHKRYSGTELTIPIVGYDPRDLLSGHYLVYRLDWDSSICRQRPSQDVDVYVCVVEKEGSVDSYQVSSASAKYHEKCTAIVKGHCEHGRFVAGVERYYIPENQAKRLDRIVRGFGENASRAKLVISVDYAGKAVVKDLLIDDVPLKDFLKNLDEKR